MATRAGHNVIASIGYGAGIAAASVALELGVTVTFLGTPAEEGGRGKIKLLAAGAFDEILPARAAASRADGEAMGR